MATSLAEQLRRLKVPQTSVLVDSKIKQSIIFDKKDAATKDRKTIFQLGQKGISELSALNPAFIQFEKTLFDPHTIELERSVENSEVNKLINKTIKKFFYHLSPYFMLQPAHLCLEWLIRRFHIHQFNKDEFIDLILPYHETNIFVKCLQTMNLSDPNGKWIWMNASLKAGVPLSKTAIQNRASEDASFLRSICNSTLESVRELDNRSNTLQTKINFYCITVIAALENCKTVKETHISCILPALLKGFSSNSLDFSASSFMITALLISKANLKEDILENLLSKICNVEHRSLQIDILLLSILIYQLQSAIKQFPEKLLINFISKKSHVSNIKELSERGIRVTFLCVPLIRACFDKIHNKDPEWPKCQSFLTNLFDEVRFQEHESKIVIRSILESNQSTKRNFSEDDIVELDSDDENELLQEDIKKMYSGYLYQLEKQYPSVFDIIVKETMQGQGNISEKRKQALKFILAFRLKSSYSEDSTSIYENLYHPNSENRIAAINYINQNFRNLTLTNEGKSMIKDSLADRLSDDDQKVLVEVLKISPDNFLKIMDIELYLEKLIKIFIRCNSQKNMGFTIKTNVIEHMTNVDLVKTCDTNRILITLLPLIVSENENDLKLLKKLSKKESITFIPFLKEYFLHSSTKIPKTIQDFENIMQEIKSFPIPESILKTFENVNECFYENSTNCTFILLVLSHSFLKYKTNATLKLKAFKIYESIEKRMKFVPQSNNFLQVIKPNSISLSIALNFLLSLLKDSSCEKKTFTSQSETSNLLRRIFEVVLTKAFSEKNSLLKDEYGYCLKNLLKQIFQSSTEILEYLSFYFIFDRINKYNIDYELQIRAIKLFNCIITGDKKDFSINRNILIKLILGLNNSESIIRKTIIETLQNVLKLESAVSENDLAIISKILESEKEILMDEFQITVVFFTLLCYSETNDKKFITITRDFLNSVLKILNDDKEKIVLKALLLNVMKLANNTKILENLINLGCKILEEAKLKFKDKIALEYFSAEIYKNIIDRFDAETITILAKNRNAWDFIENSLVNHNILININGKIQSIASIIMNVFETDVYDKMPVKYKEIFLRHIIGAMSNATESTVSITGAKLIKRLHLDGDHIKTILIQMKNLCGNNPNSGRAISLQSTVNCLNLAEWKIGITLLELLQNIKNIENSEILIPILFDLLSKCLEFEEQVALDYAKQLILSCLINLSQKIQEVIKKSKYKFNDNTLRMDLVVQCIRSTQNPQTHHHALMLLSHFANIVPQQILHNITNVFTFMGSSVVRQDDSFTFQILINVIESVIPMLVESCSDGGISEQNNKDSKVIPILKVFSDIILDVPEHRRLLLYTKLIKTLNAKQYLWMFLCVLFESHVVNDDKEKLQKSKVNNRNLGRSSSPEELPKRLSIALQICKDFEPTILIETCVALFVYLRKLPEEKVKESNEMSIDVTELETSLFYVINHTDKQFRHYKFSILQFMSALTSSTDFVNSIASLSLQQQKLIKPYFQDFIIKILSFIPHVMTAAERNAATNHNKFWKIILHHCTEILDNAISLLSADMLLLVVHGLIQHQLSVVRKKVIELLITKLQYKMDYFDKCNKENMIKLLEPLKDIIKSVLNKVPVGSNINSNHDEANIQHLALIAIKLLSKELALICIDDFKEILALLSKILKKRSSTSKTIVAAVVLAISEISSNLKAHSISNLYKFMPYIVEVLNDEAENIKNQAPDNITIAIFAGVYKLFDSLPLFLGPYYMDLFALIIKVWVQLDNRISDNRSQMMYNKLNSIWSKVSSSIPLRLLTPHCENIYTKLIEEENYRGIIYLMKLLKESFINTEGADINILQNELTKFFITILDFRTNLNDCIDTKEINEIENEILETFVSLILKLSESSFRPLYQKLYDWAMRNSGNDNDKLLNRGITYFSLSEKISGTLKSLFVLFASDFIQDAANLLIKCNYKSEKSDKKSDKLSEKFEEKNKCVILLENILKTLYNIFLYDTQGFISVHRFDILMSPITDHIENTLVIGNEELQTVLINCISQLAVVVSNDVSWKRLNYEVLLKSRNDQIEIKMLSLKTCIEVAKKLGEDFSSLLPETIPFMAELLENDNTIIEEAGRKTVIELEKVVGESLQKYF
ncbi:HEAT repeat-containing protein 1 homolog [Condylostylus longicornis]|uniref:HEAT repeat-containing protein 1 homolog n=1 Tax=Condylostylus longicornis TaxID=2530218 RepID=UPI00244DE949|nr:HEAT repeat-containing protein 1 homolog [Condylostylus longicornis]